jgi:hypothetical protein
MKRVVVRVYELSQYIDVTRRRKMRKVTPHDRFQSSVETFHYSAFDVVVFAGVELYTAVTQ